MSWGPVFLEKTYVLGYQDVSPEIPDLAPGVIAIRQAAVQCRSTLAALTTSAAVIQEEAEQSLYRVILI
ncbi:hypothetical protein FRC04_002190 [Tulasnella sp. 424]|nr:hypothetical protein FRC04_002190 [Tulasnella sp. 424]